MKCVIRFAFACITVLLFVNLAESQQKGQPANNGQVGQQGQTMWWQGSGYYGGVGQTPWFSNPTMRQQLKLNDDQSTRLNQAYNQAWQSYQQGYNKLGKNLTEQQRAQQLGKLQNQFYTNFTNNSENIFADPQQRQRFNQLNWQYRGYDAFNDPMIQQKLNLTPEQRTKLQTYGQNWNKQMDTWRQQYGSNPQGGAKAFTDMRQNANNQLNQILTPQQQQTWQGMVGQPYNFQSGAYFQGNNGTAPSTPK